MECHNFNDDLEALLNGELDVLPSSAEDHMQHCKKCAAEYDEMLNLRRMVRNTPQPTLTPQSEAFLVRSIVNKVASSADVKSPAWKVANLISGLHWERVLLTSGLAIAIIGLALRFSEPDVSDSVRYHADTEIQELLEEHALVMDSGIFQGTSQYAKLITASDEKPQSQNQ